MSIKLTYRDEGTELMDQPDADVVMLSRTLNYIDFVNRILGGYQVLFGGLAQLFQMHPEKQSWRILDLGCGHGYLLKQLEIWAKNQSCTIELTGLDNNAEAVRLAQLAAKNSNVKFIVADALSPEIDFSKYDIVIATLFLHHLSDDQIVALLTNLNKSRACVLINDLHRSQIALMLFKVFAFFTRAPHMAVHDGLLSIRKGFSADELRKLASISGFVNFRISWKWAFRYQLLLLK